jgi:hypothetical protein
VSRFTKMKVHPAMLMKTKGRENAKWRGRDGFGGNLPSMIPYPWGEGACEQKSSSRPRVPCPLSRFTKMKVHPAICMKTKERKK